MTKIEKFIENLRKEDIDLVDKLDNLYGHGQISETVYIRANRKDNFDPIENFVKEILQGNIWDLKLAEKYINFIVEETQRLYEEELIDDAADFTAGLYNCDEIYLYAIADALYLKMDELETYESEDE